MEERDRRRQILEAAFEEFAVKGFRGATIKSIAESAGLQSPALIYWYFKDKEALFREVLVSQALRAPILQVVSDPDSIMDLPPEQALRELGRAYFGFERFDRRTMQLIAGEVVRRRELAEMFVRTGPARVLGFIQEYLDRQIQLGRLRPHDTRCSSRAFLGMLVPQLLGQLFFPQLLEDGPTDEEHLRGAIDIFLEGLRPE